MKTKERMADTDNWTKGERMAEVHAHTQGVPHSKRDQPAWVYSQRDYLAGFAARGKLDAEIASEYTSCDFDDSAQWAAGQILCAIHDLDSAKDDT